MHSQRTHLLERLQAIPNAAIEVGVECTMALEYDAFDDFVASGEGYRNFVSMEDKKICRHLDGITCEKEGDWCESCCHQNGNYPNSNPTLKRPTDDVAFVDMAS